MFKQVDRYVIKNIKESIYKDVINKIPEITPKTIDGYNRRAERCVNYGIDILRDDEDIIINKIKNLKDVKKSFYLDSINVCIVIKKVENLPHDLLIEYRNKLRKEDKKEATEVNTELKTIDMPSTQDLINFMKDNYKNKLYRNYIINYLVINFNCRPTDLNLIITLSNNEDEIENYLIMETDKVIFIRNNYKTKETYDVKKDVIKDSKFINSCKILINKNKGENNYLLSSGRANRATNASLFVSKRLMNNLTCGEYFKIIVDGTDKNNMIFLANKRGTSLEMMHTRYNINQNF